MKIQTVTTRTLLLSLAGAFALASQSASSGDVKTIAAFQSEEWTATARQPEEMIVTAPRPSTEFARADIEIDVSELMEMLNRRLAEDLKKILDEISDSPIELAVSEVATRG